MPRILMINSVCTGSHGQIMRDLQASAKVRGYDVKMAFGRGAAEVSDAYRIGSRQDVLLHVALTRTLDRHARGSLKATRRFLDVMDTYQPDLIHLHNVHGYYLHAETVFDHFRKHSLPVLWTHHDCWALTGHCSHFVRADCDRWQTGCYRCPLKHAYPASYGLDASRANWHWKKEAFTSGQNIRLVLPSQWLSDVIEASFFRSVDHRVISSGVDVECFAPADAQATAAIRKQYGLSTEQKILLAVAFPFDERKGYADVLEVARMVGNRAQVVAVGLSQKQYRKMPSNVVGVMRLDNPQALAALYSASDCLINPTYEDTYPTVNMEAMACGLPVVCYATSGATEQLISPYGTAVPVGDIKVLSARALEVADQSGSLRLGCREFALTNFDRMAAMDQYMGLYQSMIGA